MREHLGKETSDTVKKEIATGLALAALDDSDPKARLVAIETLKTSVARTVRNSLASMLENEKDDQVRKAASAAMSSIDHKRDILFGI